MLCRPPHTAYSTTTRILSERFKRFYLKDSKDFINIIKNTKLPKNTILASMDVTSLYTNITLEEGITTVCKAYEDFYKNRLPIPTKFLRRMLCLILKENSFQFNRRHYLQTHGTAMGTKMAVAFANIFMAKIEKRIISKSIIKPLVWKRYIDDVFCLWDTNEDNIKEFVTRASHYHDTIKFTAEISDSEIAFLDTKLYKGSTLHVQTHYKQTETFQYTNFYSCHPPGVKKGFIKGEALRLLRTKGNFKSGTGQFCDAAGSNFSQIKRPAHGLAYRFTASRGVEAVSQRDLASCRKCE